MPSPRYVVHLTQLCLLAPLVEHEFDGFYMVRVPFRDDVRRWAFPPLDRIVTSAGHTVRTHPSIPTPTQQAQMDTFVAQMDLMDMDDDGDPEGYVGPVHLRRWYAPSLSYAPAVHGTKQAILHRFLHPGTPLPPLHPSLTVFLHTPPRAEARARAAREACAAATGSGIPPAAQAPDVSASDSARYATPPMPIPSDSEATPTDDETTSLGVTVAGSALRFTHAAHDFETLVHSTPAVSETCAAMAQLLLRWLDRDPPTDEILAALRAFRSAACALDESLTWNTYVAASYHHQLRAHLSYQGAVPHTDLVAQPAGPPRPRADYRERRPIAPLPGRSRRGARFCSFFLASTTMRTTLAHDTHLVGAACNPCMDLVAMVGCDRAPPAAASAPPGLTPAQLAMRQRVLAMQARRMGVANPTAASGSHGVRRGPTLQLVVWRMGAAPSCVWAVPIEPPRPQGLHDADECVSVLDLCWSPDGTSFH